MSSVLRQFLVCQEQHGIFSLCGKEFRRHEDFGTHVTAKHNIDRVQPITCDMKHGLTRKAAADEIHQLRSVTQSLAYIERQTPLDLSYGMSKIQGTFENACVPHLRECNRIVEYATSTSTRGIYFSSDFSWDDAVAMTISDASFCQEPEQITTGLYQSLVSSHCKSPFTHLISPNTKEVDNKHLTIDLSALKQLIWDNRDDCDEEVDGSKGDHPRWIDTFAMLADFFNEDDGFWPIE